MIPEQKVLANELTVNWFGNDFYFARKVARKLCFESMQSVKKRGTFFETTSREAQTSYI